MINNTDDMLKVLDIISNNPDCFYVDIVNKSGLSRHEVSNIIEELSKCELVDIKDCSLHTISQKGKLILIDFSRIKGILKHRYGYWIK